MDEYEYEPVERDDEDENDADAVWQGPSDEWHNASHQAIYSGAPKFWGDHEVSECEAFENEREARRRERDAEMRAEQRMNDRYEGTRD